MEMKSIKSLEDCATECLNAYKACQSALEFCLSQGGKLVEPGHIRQLRVCAEICHTSAFVLLTHSTFHMRTCAICAEACEACAASCEYLENEKLNNYAETLRECADACVGMTMAEAA